MFSGIGIAELLVIIAVALVLFGAPALVAFWLGYRAGSRRASDVSPAEKSSADAALPDRSPEDKETES